MIRLDPESRALLRAIVRPPSSDDEASLARLAENVRNWNDVVEIALKKDRPSMLLTLSILRPNALDRTVIRLPKPLTFCIT